MHEAPWLKACKRLAVGQTARFRCCGRDKAAVLYNKPGSWEMWCNRCKQPAYVRKEFVLQQAQEPERPVQPEPADVIRIEDASAETQHSVYSFLATKGLMPDMVQNLKWSDTSKRLVFPVSSTLSLGRAMTPWQNPKWIQYGGRSAFVPGQPTGTVTGIVLTEDLLSALKVQYVSNKFGSGDVLAVALLGTRLDNKLKVWIAEQGLPVLLMLDGDEAGYAAVPQIKRRLRPYVPVRDWSKDGFDPKDLTCSEILEAISGCSNHQGDVQSPGI